MRRKSKHSELPKNINITYAPRRRFKDECDECKTYKQDVHSYLDKDGTVYILCPECAKKNKSIIRDWKGEEIIHENKNSKKTRTKKSAGEDNSNSGDTENGSEDSRQLLHSGISGREGSSEQSEHRPGRRKKKSV